MWNNYFLQIKKKYNMRVSSKKPLVINLDGKNVTKSREFNILELYKGGFREVVEKCAIYFTKQYDCIAICGADEISFIIEEPMKLVEDINSDNNTSSTEIISVFSQMFYDYFNRFYKGENIFWHGKCYSISDEKIMSFVKYKSRLIEVLTTTYYLKRAGTNDAGNISLSQKKELCANFDDYEKIKPIEKGRLYKSGKRIDIDEYLHGNIVEIADDMSEAETNNTVNFEGEIEIEI